MNESPRPGGAQGSGLRPDLVDFRDRVYRPALVEVQASIPLQQYLARAVPVLRQPTEGPCTGFALATVINFLLRTRDEGTEPEPVSPWMLYQMARRYDEWVGTDYVGTSARGAMKGWSKHGACSDALWPEYEEDAEYALGAARARDAATRPLGAYYRVEHSRVVDMHCALEEVGIIYATAWTHSGWHAVGDDGQIPLGTDRQGLHAFAIVAYDEEGFWVQNSWGEGWGRGGLGHLSYEDWLEHGTDAWIARLGVPMRASNRVSGPQRRAPSGASPGADSPMAGHVVSVKHDGGFLPWGRLGMTEGGLQGIFEHQIPRATEAWPRKRILCEIPGGLGQPKEWAQQLQARRPRLLAEGIYPLLVAWSTGLGRLLPGIVQGALGERASGRSRRADHVLADRIDETVELLVRREATMIWDTIKQGAVQATRHEGGAVRALAGHMAELAAKDDAVELHLAAHGSGALLAVQLVSLLTTHGRITQGPLEGLVGHGCRVESLTLWSPACTIESFEQTCLPALREGGVGSLELYTLLDPIERSAADLEGYGRSLLYLVSSALEDAPRIPPSDYGVGLLGMSRCVAREPALCELWTDRRAIWLRCPVADPDATGRSSDASEHEAFLADERTRQSLRRHVLTARRPDDPHQLVLQPIVLEESRPVVAANSTSDLQQTHAGS